MLVLLTVLATGVFGLVEEKFASNPGKKVYCTSDADCKLVGYGYTCDLTYAKDIKGTKYGMCRMSCTNAESQEVCDSFKESFCTFDYNAKYYSDYASQANAVCQQACDPHCKGSVPLIHQRGGHYRNGVKGEFCSHHADCEGDLLCDYTQNVVKIVGYTMGVCRELGCTEPYGREKWYSCDVVREDPSKCGMTRTKTQLNWRSCRKTCDPMCYGAEINTVLRDELDLYGHGVDTKLVAVHAEEPGMSASLFVQGFAVFGFIVTAYGAGKHYLSK